MNAHILIVDDEEDIRSLISGILEDEGYTTSQAATFAQADQYIQNEEPQLVLLDVCLGSAGDEGLELLQNIRCTHPQIPVVMMSGHGTFEMAVSAIKNGAYNFIEKPFQTECLLIALQHALEVSKLRMENSLLQMRFEDERFLVGHSTSIKKLHNIIQKVAPTKSRVLIQGEAGTGKEQVAHAIHAQSTRKNGPFVVLNCAALHPDHLEGALLGNCNKSNHQIGAFDRAHGGTLLLDEVTDIPFLTQGKIVQILHNQALYSADKGQSYRLPDVRVLASTRANIHHAIKNGLFREELYYRLNIIPIHTPPPASQKRRHFNINNRTYGTSSSLFGCPSAQVFP